MVKINKFINLLSSSALISVLFISSATAEYLFTAPPRESAAKGLETYGPLVAKLSQIMGSEVKYVHPKNWPTYKKFVKSGDYDFVFDGPHFVSWRFNNTDVDPLVRLPGDISFVLVAAKDNNMIKTKEDLISRKICVIPSPHLGTLAIYSMFPNQVQQPKFVASAGGGFKKVYASFKAGKCDAAVFRESFYKHNMDDNAREALKVLATSPTMTNQGITISKRVSADKQKKIAEFLVSKEGSEAADNLLKRFSKKNKKFIYTSKNEYDGQNLLVDNMIFGW
ncbi:MAG: phosphate/phosphite/phosphonate ABC transporter substrate-binding protein [Gammaproteobacteria bacterium]|nr:phosphate/phosphite/phosphonate ABC transporter substrate-binding protein [Gammaproteobacteria bacterium]